MRIGTPLKPLPPRTRHLSILLVLLLFVAAGLLRFWRAPGDDLASSYIGCRIVATGQTGALYQHDPANFADVGDPAPVWHRLAAQGRYGSWLHPYVQTPLWAWSLQPLCDHTYFGAFKETFAVLALLSIAGYTWLVARFWTPQLFHPVAIALVLLALWFSQPFGYAMFLVQTHALFLFLTVAGLILAERRRPILGGLLVAGAAAIKLTPAILVVYWLLTRRWRAAFSFALGSALLVMLTRLAVGPHLLAAYFADLHRVSRVLLVAENNQSLASWWMGRFFDPDEIFEVNAFALPTAVRLGSTALMLACTVVAGWMDRERSRHLIEQGTEHGTARSSPVPLGAGFALVAMTVFAPIAWTHYYILLTIPLMMLVQENLELRPHRLAWLLAGLAVIIAVLNYPPLAGDVIHMDLGRVAILRGQFFAGVLCLLALGLAAYLRRRSSRVAAAA